MRVAITGSIACGKSTVTNYLINKGYYVVDADKIGHEILLDEQIKNELKAVFGEVIFENGEVDRKKLGEIVFNNEKSLNILNSIVHPKIKEVISNKLNVGMELVFLDIALLYESNFVDLVDKVIVVDVDEKTQLERLMLRNNFTEEEAKKRIASQMSSSKKVKLADYVIDNNNNVLETYEQVDKLLAKLEGESNGFKN